MRTAARAVGEEDAPCPFGQETVHDRPCSTTGAEHHCRSPLLVPAGGRRVKIGDETVSVRIARIEPARLVEPQRVGGPDRARRLVGDRRRSQGRLFMRQGDIGAGIAALLERAEKLLKILRTYGFLFVGAIDPVLLEPVAMDQR